MKEFLVLVLALALAGFCCTHSPQIVHRPRSWSLTTLARVGEGRTCPALDRRGERGRGVNS
jgi:hypothetical protein